jgi:hypothetical protein
LNGKKTHIFSKKLNGNPASWLAGKSDQENQIWQNIFTQKRVNKFDKFFYPNHHQFGLLVVRSQSNHFCQND